MRTIKVVRFYSTHSIIIIFNQTYRFFFLFLNIQSAMGKTRWTEAMVETLLSTLYEQVVRGERAENGFKKKAWTAAKESLREAHEIDLEASQLKTKWSNVC